MFIFIEKVITWVLSIFSFYDDNNNNNNNNHTHNNNSNNNSNVTGTEQGPNEHGNETSGYLKDGNFLSSWAAISFQDGPCLWR
jgi:hypothetical protein